MFSEERCPGLRDETTDWFLSWAKGRMANSSDFELTNFDGAVPLSYFLGAVR